MSDVQAVIDELYRTEPRRAIATLVHPVGGFDRAEGALHDAFMAALEQWPSNAIPFDYFINHQTKGDRI